MFFMCMIMNYIQSSEANYQQDLSYVSALVILLYKQYYVFELSVSGDRKLVR